MSASPSAVASAASPSARFGALTEPIHARVAEHAAVDLRSLPNPCVHVKAVPIVPKQFSEPRRPVNFEDGWAYFRKIGSPKHICAPMVNQSELAFRILCRRYGTTLAYTPMFHAEIFGKDPSYRRDAMQVPLDAALDRPVVAQFCANDPELLLKAAKHVEHCVDAVDINLGCPQGIAKRGHYGAFLLEEYQLLHDMVSTLHQHLSVPVTCKIRRLKTDEATIALVRMLQEAGAALITIHGRSRFQLKDKVGACDFDLIRLVKQNAAVPVLANGGIFDAADVARCLAYTGVDGVMSSEALLCNPSLFAGRREDSVAIAREYLQIVDELAARDKLVTEQSMVRAHLFKFLFQHLALPRNHDLRDQLAHCEPQLFAPLVEQVAARFAGLSPAEVQAQLDTVPLWYHRHQPTPAQLQARAEKAARLAKEREALRAEEEEGMCAAFDMFNTEEDEGCATGNCQQQEAH